MFQIIDFVLSFYCRKAITINDFLDRKGKLLKLLNNELYLPQIDYLFCNLHYKMQLQSNFPHFLFFFIFQRHKGMSMTRCFLEITLIFCFIVMYLCLRIMPQWINYSDIYVTKTVLSVGLIFFFYRLPNIYLPISPTLGPMLVRMNRMVI